jgi:hypothetical protein
MDAVTTGTRHISKMMGAALPVHLFAAAVAVQAGLILFSGTVARSGQKAECRRGAFLAFFRFQQMFWAGAVAGFTGMSTKGGAFIR